MHYSYLYRLCAWLEYSACYCTITSQIYSEPYDGEYRTLAGEILESSQPLYALIFAQRNSDRIDYDRFI